MKKKFSQKSLYLIYVGSTAFFFSLVFTVSQLYRIELVNLDPLQLVLVGTVLELSCFIFEIPTGIIADIWSRKLSVIIGVMLIGIAFIIEGLIPQFIFVLLSQVLWGIGYTFTSGADEAWIAEELNGSNLEPLYLKGAQIAQASSLLGILISAAIGYKLINLPIIIGGALFIVLGLFLTVFMKETNFTPAPKEDRNTFTQMIFTFKQGIGFIKGKPVLILMVGIALFYGLYSEGIDRLWTAHFIKNIAFPNMLNLKPIAWIGIINGCAMVLSIIAVEFIKRKMHKNGERNPIWVLIMINGFMVISIILLGLSRNFNMALSMYMTFYILRTTNDPIFRAFRNRNIKSEVRATVISTYGQVDALGQIIGGPIIGFIALKSSISIGIIVSGIILSPIIVLYFFSINKRSRVSYK